jgi:hypothetical protein
MKFCFAARNNTPEAQKGLIDDLTKVLDQHLEKKDKISSKDKTLITKVYAREKVNATYIQSNLPGWDIVTSAGGEVSSCSAVIYVYGESDTKLFEVLKKAIEHLAKWYSIR